MIAKSCDVVRGREKGHRKKEGNCSSRRVDFVDIRKIYEYSPHNYDPDTVQIKTADHKRNRQTRRQIQGYAKVDFNDKTQLEKRQNRNIRSDKKADKIALRNFLQVRNRMIPQDGVRYGGPQRVTANRVKASTIKSQRTFMLDSGSSIHLMNIKDITHKEGKKIRPLPKSVTLQTANGTVTSSKGFKLHIPALGVHDDCHVTDVAPKGIVVLSLG